MTKRVALITGVSGLDGAYLSELPLAKGYEVKVQSNKAKCKVGDV